SRLALIGIVVGRKRPAQTKAESKGVNRAGRRSANLVRLAMDVNRLRVVARVRRVAARRDAGSQLPTSRARKMAHSKPWVRRRHLFRGWKWSNARPRDRRTARRCGA